MKYFTTTKDLQYKDITLSIKFKNFLMYFVILILIGINIQSVPIRNQKIVYIEKHDTIKELSIWKHGLTEIKVDRNENIPNFCNNPGNLRPSKIQEIKDLAVGIIGTRNGEFLYFTNNEHGFKALEILLKKEYWDNTITQMVYKYCPDGNEKSYIQRITKALKCSVTQLVRNCNLKQLMKIIAEIEGFTFNRK